MVYAANNANDANLIVIRVCDTLVNAAYSPHKRRPACNCGMFAGVTAAYRRLRRIPYKRAIFGQAYVFGFCGLLLHHARFRNTSNPATDC